MTGTLFGLTFLVAAPFWALMILLPRWRWTERIIGSPAIVVPVLVIYAILVIPALPDLLPVVTQPTLDGLREALGSANGAAAAWAHMIAFDLFVGRWIFIDANNRKIGHWIIAPTLVLTILFGPLGLGVYLAARKTLG